MLAVVGWVAGTQVEVVSDITRLVPGDQREVRDLKTLQRYAGTSGDVNVLVRSERLLDPDVVRWMSRYQSRGPAPARVQRRAGPARRRSCARRSRSPTCSAPGARAPARSSSVDRRAAALLLAERDHRRPPHGQHRVRHPHDAARQAEGAGRRHAGAARPAARGGCRAGRACRCWPRTPTPSLESSRWWLTLAGLAAVFLVLLAAYRRLEAAAVPLIPIALATGWSSLLLFVLQIPLNPMSATLGALVIAISTEFAVILSARYRAERAARARAGGRAVAHLRAHGRRGAGLRRRPRSRASPCCSSATSRCCATSAR